MQQISLSTKLNRLSEKARKEPETTFSNLAHFLTEELLLKSFYDLKRGSSAGIDGITFIEYEDNLRPRIAKLYLIIKENRYKAQALRRVYIPKENGKKRPLSIPVLEDKIVQRAVVNILNCIYEHDFLPCSYGYRPKRSAHHAIKDVRTKIATDNVSYVLDADIEDFFGSIDRKLLLSIIEKRVKDNVIKRLIGKWLKVGVLENGKISTQDRGTHQGSVISPLLANIYLHEVLDLWLHKDVKHHMQGVCELYRYADDFIVCFQKWDDARKFQAVLPKRLKKYGLSLNHEKTKLLRFGRFAEQTIKRKNQGKRPGTFDFLGFTFMCRTSRNGKFTVHVKTQKARFQRGLKRIRIWCKRNRHLPVEIQSKKLSVMLKGHYQYYGLTSNANSMNRFYRLVRRAWHYWLSTRSQKGLGWERFQNIIEAYPLPLPTIQEGRKGSQLVLSEFV